METRSPSVASMPSNIARSRLFTQPFPHGSPTLPAQSPASELISLFPSPVTSSKSKAQPSFSSQLHIPFTRKPPCPTGQGKPGLPEQPGLPSGARVPPPLSNILIYGRCLCFLDYLTSLLVFKLCAGQSLFVFFVVNPRALHTGGSPSILTE